VLEDKQTNMAECMPTVNGGGKNPNRILYIRPLLVLRNCTSCKQEPAVQHWTCSAGCH